VVKPETILRWHRSGFKAFWRWKSRNRAGRPKIDRELRDLIQRMSRENPLWGASRIHGELLMLGFEVAQSTVSKYMVHCQDPPSQTWKTFLKNHAEAIAAIDVCIVPTLTYDLLFAFLVLAHCAASAWITWSSSARRTRGEFFPPMWHITTKRVPTWYYRKMRPYIAQSNNLAPLSPFRSWLGFITNTFGCDFRKGHECDRSVDLSNAAVELLSCRQIDEVRLRIAAQPDEFDQVCFACRKRCII